MIKKLFSLISLALVALSFSSCSGRQTLLFLNWGEYIDEELITAFEEEYNCNVLMDLGESNEIFYSKVKAGTTVYDVVCPSDYMVEKMYKNNLLEKIDYTKLTCYKPFDDNSREGVKSIVKKMQENTDAEIKDYFVPYLWGTWGIMYSTLVSGLEEKVLTNDNEWACLFDRNALPLKAKVAMYDSHQHAYYAACRYLGYDVYEELPESKLNTIRDLIKNMKYNAWGTDSIKKDIVAKNIDLGFMWTGDFLYYYCEKIADIVMEAYDNKDIQTTDEIIEMIDTLAGEKRIYEKNGNKYQVGFDLFIPEDTIAFCDNLVITKDSMNKDLAYKFIDFMCSYEYKDYTPAFDNTYYVCYDTPYKNVYADLVDLASIDTFADVDEEGLYDAIYDYATGLSFDKYYPADGVKGSILAAFTRQYIKQINTAFNNARA